MLNKKSKLSILSKTLMTIFALGGAVVVNSSCFAASVFGLNTVSMSEDETVFENKSAEKGGAIYNDSVNKLNKFNNVRFDNNEATKGNGGAILNVAHPLALSGQVTFNANKALKGNGGAIANDAKSTTIIKGDSTFTKNSALRGGSIHNEGYFSLSGTQVFNGNSSSLYGGAIMNSNSGSNLQIEGVTTFTGNNATNMGGGDL